MSFFFQAEDGIRDLVRSRGLGDVYKRQHVMSGSNQLFADNLGQILLDMELLVQVEMRYRRDCLLYTSDAADERSSVDLGGRRIIKKKNSLAVLASACI